MGIERPPLPEGPYLVVGLARSGVAAALALRARGLEVAGTDSGEVDAQNRTRLEDAGVRVVAPSAGTELLAAAQAVVKSPGVPGEAPVIAAARGAGLPVLGELEVAWRLLPNPFLAVTGSNGKTTTVELLGAMFAAAGVPARVAGNVGTALSSLVGELEPEATVVCEASSFQLEDAEAFAPEVAVLLNVQADHLDRHGSLAAYREAKLRIFARQPEDAVAVLPHGSDAADAGGQARQVTFGGPDADLADDGRRLLWRGEALLGHEEIRLRGAHNRENAMAAAAAALSAGLPGDAVRTALREFAGVEHRLEEVAVRDGVTWVNDSKATNVASALVALASFPGDVHLIAGGRGKGDDYSLLVAPVIDRCRAVYLIGEEGPRIAETLAGTSVPVRESGDLGTAVSQAREAARPGDVVLLSPACASFDQYASFEHRGRHFKALVAAKTDPSSTSG